MDRPEIRGNHAKLWDAVLHPEKHDKVREILIHGPGGTGKSRAILEWIWWCANTFHGLRILICRKTRVSLTEAGLVTLEEQVIPPGHPVLDGPGRANRGTYSLKNGTEIVTGGMDYPTRLYSTEWDIIYFQEAQESVEDEWERLRRGLRHFILPVQVLVGDCNPESKHHFLYRRMRDGKTEGWESRHWDNPRLYDAKQHRWTAEGLAYLESLSRLSGVRRDRLYRGEWVSATGAVWENFDTSLHVIDRPADTLEQTGLQKLGIIKYFGSIDWGFSSAGVLHIWGVDHDQRIYLVEEHYHMEMGLPEWMELAAKADAKYRLLCIVADPARSDSLTLANDYLHKMGKRRLIWKAHNRRQTHTGHDMGGLDLVRHKLGKDKSGKASIYILRDSLIGRDQRLVELRRCSSLVEEIPGYVFQQTQDGKPSKEATDPHCDDHACFPGETRITMGDGSEKAIRDVRVGDLVLTPNGPEPVTAAALTAKNAALVRLGPLTATPDHPVWVVGKGMVSIDEIGYADAVCELKPANASVSPGTATRTQETGATGTSPERSEGRGSAYTDSCGRDSTDRSRQVTTSTTSTGTGRTTTPTTSCASAGPRTEKSTEPIGMDSCTHAMSEPSAASAGGCASAVASGSKTSATWGRGSVEAHARLVCTGGLILDTTLSRHGRPEQVLERADVYNLTVGSTHAFFANGILVSNCDSLRYAACFMWMRDVSEAKEGDKFGSGTWGKITKHGEFWNSLRR